MVAMKEQSSDELHLTLCLLGRPCEIRTRDQRIKSLDDLAFISVDAHSVIPLIFIKTIG